MNALIERVFGHLKTTLGGASATALLAIALKVYVPGMSGKQWAAVAIPLVVGALLKDPGSSKQPAN